MSTTVGILAHVDAGKTTLAEQILYQSGAIRTAGRVDRQNAFLDSDGMERERGITIFSGQAPFCWKGREFDLLDTPGHSDFSGEMERALWVMDCAVLVVSAAEGIQSHTGTVWRLLRKNRIPTVVFLNKTDRVGADPEAVRARMEQKWGIPYVRWVMQPDGSFSEAMQEELASLDEGLMEAYFSGSLDQESWFQGAKDLFAAGKFCPVLQGTALAGEGVEPLLDLLALLAPPCAGSLDEPFSGKVYQVRHGQTGRLALVKVLSGRLRARDLVQLPGTDGDGNPLSEKAGELRKLNGARSVSLEEAGPGSLCAVAGLSGAGPGDQIGAGAAHNEPFTLRPLLSARAELPEGLAAQTALGWFRELEDEEPLLAVRWDSRLGEISVRVMGKMQLDVLQKQLLSRYGAAVTFGSCRVLYQETLAAPVRGCGHFEPLRHYAEVHLLLSPAERGSGISFESACPTDELAASWQHLVRTHVLEKEHLGVLTGMPLTDVKVTLLAGRSHLKHTEGGDFREATYRAVRQGLMAGECVLLEPWVSYEIEVPASLVGRVLTDVQKMQGEADAPVMDVDSAIVTGRAPASGMMDYPAELTSLTRGKGRISTQFSGYAPCRNAQEVIAAIGYEPERDLENPPGSVFCSHGAGFPVSWKDAPSYMHVKL